jgi:hypothetical protein
MHSNILNQDRIASINQEVWRLHLVPLIGLQSPAAVVPLMKLESDALILGPRAKPIWHEMNVMNSLDSCHHHYLRSTWA